MVKSQYHRWLKSLEERIRELCKAEGFSDVGFARCEPTGRSQELLEWLAAGKHAQMDYLMEQVAERLDPQMLLEGAVSLIVVADQYGLRGSTREKTRAGEGRIARYARGRDYHEFVKRRLHNVADALRPEFPGHKFRACVDTAPLLEREYAARAGLGWTGKNTMLIHPVRGSFFVIGSIVTTLELAEPEAKMADYCGTCTRCIDACPTKAISPYSVDGSKCISYLTIEHRGEIEPRFHRAMGDWIFGCDVCQEVCPHNSARSVALSMPELRPGKQEPRPGDWGTAAPREIEIDPHLPVQPAYAVRRTGFSLLDVLNWDEEARRQAFATSAMKRATLENMKRNALIAAGNSLAVEPNVELLARVKSLAADAAETQTIRSTAAAVVAALGAG